MTTPAPHRHRTGREQRAHLSAQAAVERAWRRANRSTPPTTSLPTSPAPADDQGGHRWTVYAGIPCCEACGVVRRRDAANRPCGGPAPITLRTPPPPSAPEPAPVVPAPVGAGTSCPNGQSATDTGWPRCLACDYPPGSRPDCPGYDPDVVNSDGPITPWRARHIRLALDAEQAATR